jgi:hypothetical protein
MKRSYIAVLLATICVLGLGAVANAEEEDIVIAAVPYDFVAGGVAFSRGTYRVSRIDSGRGTRELKISNYETRINLLLLPTEFDDVQTGHLQISFVHVCDKYFLNGITTPAGTYTISVPRTANAIAQVKDHGTVSSAGAN